MSVMTDDRRVRGPEVVAAVQATGLQIDPEAFYWPARLEEGTPDHEPACGCGLGVVALHRGVIPADELLLRDELRDALGLTPGYEYGFGDAFDPEVIIYGQLVSFEKRVARKQLTEADRTDYRIGWEDGREASNALAEHWEAEEARAS